MLRRLVALALAVIFAAAYDSLLRRRILNWGATDAEARSRLPGDDLLENADGVSTRAITIDAPVGAVWPWLAQLGPSPRGGAYTYDWIENLLGLDMQDGNWVWTFVLEGRRGGTRLVSRNRFRLRGAIARLGMLPMEPASLVMEQKMLRGIKQRAEDLKLSSPG
jgi:hypothetical protein